MMISLPIPGKYLPLMEENNLPIPWKFIPQEFNENPRSVVSMGLTSYLHTFNIWQCATRKRWPQKGIVNGYGVVMMTLREVKYT